MDIHLQGMHAQYIQEFQTKNEGSRHYYWIEQKIMFLTIYKNSNIPKLTLS